jgi:hypothetical protein
MNVKRYSLGVAQTEVVTTEFSCTSSTVYISGSQTVQCADHCLREGFSGDQEIPSPISVWRNRPTRGEAAIVDVSVPHTIRLSYAHTNTHTHDTHTHTRHTHTHTHTHTHRRTNPCPTLLGWSRFIRTGEGSNPLIHSFIHSISMPSAGIETAIPAIERPQTYALNSMASGIGHNIVFG